jgi:imidazole glycerol phosphate synthase glutamine amidotransferase subunit
VSTSVVVVRTGSANLASVVNGFARLGVESIVSDDAVLIRNAPLVVLPGVGSFGTAVRRLRTGGLDCAITGRVESGRPLLAICLGMQLLCEGSEESEGELGLAVLPGIVSRFTGVSRVPQMGWNRISASAGASLLRSAPMYFANSYRLEQVPRGWEGATCEYGGSFAAAVERGALLACQFHPELSGRYGLELIGRWLEAARAAEGVAC